MRLNDISDNPKARTARKRVGRGIGSGTGKTAARGHKGQKSRSGVSLLGFEGGQMPLHRRLPKSGFKNPFRKNYRVINVGRLQQAVDAGKIDAGKPVTEQAMLDAGLIKTLRDGVRLLAKGEITTKLTLEVSGASQAAIAAVEKAGGTVTVSAKAAKAAPAKAAAADKPEEAAEAAAETAPETGSDEG